MNQSISTMFFTSIALPASSGHGSASDLIDRGKIVNIGRFVILTDLNSDV